MSLTPANERTTPGWKRASERAIACSPARAHSSLTPGHTRDTRRRPGASKRGTANSSVAKNVHMYILPRGEDVGRQRRRRRVDEVAEYPKRRVASREPGAGATRRSVRDRWGWQIRRRRGEIESGARTEAAARWEKRCRNSRGEKERKRRLQNREERRERREKRAYWERERERIGEDAVCRSAVQATSPRNADCRCLDNCRPPGGPALPWQREGERERDPRNGPHTHPTSLLAFLHRISVWTSRRRPSSPLPLSRPIGWFPDHDPAYSLLAKEHGPIKRGGRARGGKMKEGNGEQDGGVR